MKEMVFNSDQVLVMGLLNYFITEQNYNPMVIHGIDDEIWLENLNSSDYNIVRIVSHHIHNKEQLDFDKFKLNKIVKEVKKKTFSFKIKVLNIYLDVEDDKMLEDNDIYIGNEEDINKSNLVKIFPNIMQKMEHNENGINYFVKVANRINETNAKKNKTFEKIFSYKKPIVTYVLIGICVLLFLLMYLFGKGSTDNLTLLWFGASNDTLIYEYGQYYRLFTSMFLHIGIAHLVCNMYSLYIIGKEMEMIYGKWKYLVIYLVSGICGSILSLAFTHNTISAGASGAIFGLLGTWLYFGYYYRNYMGIKMRASILPVIIINLAIGFITPGIDNTAHIGGLIAGILLGMVFGAPDKSSKTDRINGIILSVIYVAFICYLAFVRGRVL